MNRIECSAKLVRQIQNAIEVCELDLKGITVITEAASGAFVATPIVAAMAGAEVLAFTRDSSYGKAEDVACYTNSWAKATSVENRVTVFSTSPIDFAHRADIVTNLGFVRPITAEFIRALPQHAAISLMWEPWEFRPSDIDLSAARAADIPVIGTRETDVRLNTFRHVGTLIAKLLLEKNVEICGSRIVVIGSDPFASVTYDLLISMGAAVQQVQLAKDDVDLDILYGEQISKADALVLLEHRNNRQLVGNLGGIRPDRLRDNAVALIHVCGNVDNDALKTSDVIKWPERQVQFGTMTVTTDYVGPRPVIDLHCAGLKVGEVAVKIRRSGGSVLDAIRAAELTGLGLGFDF